MPKPFSRRLCEQYDEAGRATTTEVLAHLTQARLIAANDKEATGELGYWDCQYQLPGGQLVYVETEINDRCYFQPRPWCSHKIHVFQRKAKNKARLFILLSSDLDFGWMIGRQQLLQCPVVTRSCGNYGQPEESFKVYIEQGKFFERTGDSWDWFRMRGQTYLVRGQAVISAASSLPLPDPAPSTSRHTTPTAHSPRPASL